MESIIENVVKLFLDKVGTCNQNDILTLSYPSTRQRKINAIFLLGQTNAIIHVEIKITKNNPRMIVLVVGVGYGKENY